MGHQRLTTKDWQDIARCSIRRRCSATLIVLGSAVALGFLALASCVRSHGTWGGRLAAARFPNYPFAVLTVLHSPMSYAAVVLALGSAVVAPPWQRGVALVVAVVVLIAVPLLVVLPSALLVPRRFHAHVADASDWVQASGHVAPVWEPELNRAGGGGRTGLPSTLTAVITLTNLV
jgi:hypothetical protein